MLRRGGGGGDGAHAAEGMTDDGEGEGSGEEQMEQRCGSELARREGGGEGCTRRVYLWLVIMGVWRGGYEGEIQLMFGYGVAQLDGRRCICDMMPPKKKCVV